MLWEANQRMWVRMAFVFMAVLLAGVGGTFSQQKPADILVGQSIPFHSNILNRDLNLSLYLPGDYENSRNRYPVLLDPNAFLFKFDAGTVELLSAMTFIPRTIVVGLPGLPNGYVPTPYEQRDGNVSAADLTLQFFRQELMPYIDKNYRTADYRILYSHSVGGLLTMYTLFTQPDLFSAYIASSPWFQTNDQYWLKNLDKMFQAESLQGKSLFMTVGKEEAPLTRDTYVELEKWMNKKDLKGLRWKSVWFEGVDHGSMVGKSLYDGLLYLFEGWRIPDSVLVAGEIARIEEYREQMAKRFPGLSQIPIPEERLNAVGYRLINQKNYDRAVEILTYAVKTYPGSPNAYDSLAEAYLIKNDKESAIKFYRLAVEKNPGNTAFEKRILQNSRDKLKELGDNLP